MILTVHAKPGSKKVGLEQQPDGSWVARIHARAEGGKANEAIVELLAERFRIRKSSIRILTPAARHKRVMIED